MEPSEYSSDDLARLREAAKLPEKITTMRRFVLRRDVDPLGISGTGIIAEGVVSSNGKAVLFWLTRHKSVGIYDSVDEVEAIHCHGGTTEIGWIDL